MQEPRSIRSILLLWSWLAGDMHPGQAHHVATAQGIFSVCLFKVDLEEGPRALGVGREDLLGLASAPLAFPIGVCSPLSKAKALLCSQPPPSCHQSRLDREGGSPLPRDLSNEFSYSHLLTFPPVASPPFLQL